MAKLPKLPKLCARLSFVRRSDECTDDGCAVDFQVRDGKQPVGGVSAWFTADRALRVDLIEVSKEYQRCGIGTRLYELVAKEACDNKVKLRSSDMRTQYSQAFWHKQRLRKRAKCVRGKGAVRLRDDMTEMPSAHDWPCEYYEVSRPCTIKTLRGRR